MELGKHRRVPRVKTPKRGLLMRAAAELIYEKGCAASSLADIATAAGVPLGNVYHYFKTKEVLAEAVIDLRLAELREVLARAERNERPENRIHFLGCFHRIQRTTSAPWVPVRLVEHRVGEVRLSAWQSF